MWAWGGSRDSDARSGPASASRHTRPHRIVRLHRPDRQAEIAELESDLVDAYHAACHSLLRGKAYGKSHFFYLPSIERALTPPALEGRPRWNPTLVNYKGWTVVFRLYKQDNLGIEHMIEELRPLYTERDRAVAAALKR